MCKETNFYQSEVFKQIVEYIQETYGPIESFHVCGEIAGPHTFTCGGEEYHLHYLDGVIPVYEPYEDKMRGKSKRRRANDPSETLRQRTHASER